MHVPTLRDGDLVLRPKRIEDAEAITAACQDPEIPRWTFVPSPYTLDDARAFLRSSADEAAAGKAVNLLAVDARADGLLGSFSVMELDHEPDSARSATGWRPRRAAAGSQRAPCGCSRTGRATS
jgi:hypothetical protein